MCLDDYQRVDNGIKDLGKETHGVWRGFGEENLKLKTST